MAKFAQFRDTCIAILSIRQKKQKISSHRLHHLNWTNSLMSPDRECVKWTVAPFLTSLSPSLSSLSLPLSPSGGVGSPCRGGEADGGAPEWGEASGGKNEVRTQRKELPSLPLPLPVAAACQAIANTSPVFKEQPPYYFIFSSNRRPFLEGLLCVSVSNKYVSFYLPWK